MPGIVRSQLGGREEETVLIFCMQLIASKEKMIESKRVDS